MMLGTCRAANAIHVRFVDGGGDGDQPQNQNAGKISCTGELPASDWTLSSRYRSSRVIYVPVAGTYDEVRVDVDKARGVARLRARSDAVSLDVLVRLPDDRLLVVDELKAEESPRDPSWLVLSLPHANRGRWWTLTVDLYRAGLEADGRAWAASWSAAKRLAVEEIAAASPGRAGEVAAATGLPDDLARAVVGREALSLFEDARPAGWSHGACSTALWAVHECAWKARKAGAPKRAAAARLMAELLAECDVGAEEARRLVVNGLSLCADADDDAEADAWVAVDAALGRRLFVHAAILDRFALTPPIPVMAFGHMPIPERITP